MEFPYRAGLVDEAGRCFDGVVGRVLAKDFQGSVPPEAGICKECDLRPNRLAEGNINPRGLVESEARPSSALPSPGRPT